MARHGMDWPGSERTGEADMAWMGGARRGWADEARMGNEDPQQNKGEHDDRDSEEVHYWT